MDLVCDRYSNKCDYTGVCGSCEYKMKDFFESVTNVTTIEEIENKYHKLDITCDTYKWDKLYDNFLDEVKDMDIKMDSLRDKYIDRCDDIPFNTIAGDNCSCKMIEFFESVNNITTIGEIENKYDMLDLTCGIDSPCDRLYNQFMEEVIDMV